MAVYLARPKTILVGGLPTADIVGRILATVADIHQEINGEYSCSVAIPITDSYAESFIADAIVSIPDANGTSQLFRLDKPERTLEELSATGWHITQDLAQDLVLNRGWETQTGADVWPALVDAGMTETRFAGTSDIATVSSLKVVRMGLLTAMLGDQDNSFVSRFGGELERDNFTINCKTRLGTDRGYTVRYRKNLTGLTVTEDASEVVNRIVPTILNANNAAVLLPEESIDSVRVNQTAVPHVRHIHYGDIRVGEADDDGNIEYPTLDAAYEEARNRVAQLWLDQIDQPAITAEVEFVMLRDSVEYADYAALEALYLGDTVRAYYDDYTVNARMVAYDWDGLLKRYNKITLGKMRPTISAIESSIETNVAERVAATVRDQYITSLVGELAKLSQLVAGSSGSYSTVLYNADGSRVTYMHDEPTLEGSLYISCVPAPGTFVWTETGWNSGSPIWTYGTSQTGSMIMRLISTVGLVADWIQAGKLQSATQRIVFDLVNETFTIGSHTLDITTGTLKFTSYQSDEALDYEFRRSGGDKVNVKMDGTLEVTEAVSWGKCRIEKHVETGNNGIIFVF